MNIGFNVKMPFVFHFFSTLAWTRKLSISRQRVESFFLLLVFESFSRASASQLIHYYWEMKWEHIYSSLVFNLHSHSYCSCLFFFEPTIQYTFCSNDINNCHLKKRWIGCFVQIRAFLEMSVCCLLLLFPQINTLCMFVGFNNIFLFQINRVAAASLITSNTYDE